MEEIEKQDITNKLNLAMILLLTISTIVIASFILFFIGVTKVEALTWIQDIPQDATPWLIGTRSNAEITNIAYDKLNVADSIPPYSYAYILNTNSKYWSIGGTYNFLKDRVYKVRIWYSGYYFSDNSGVCVGYGSLCNSGTQTPNSTILVSNYPNTNEQIAYNNVHAGSNVNTPVFVDGYRSGKVGETTFVAGRDGTTFGMYLNTSTANTSFYLYGISIEDLGYIKDIYLNAINNNTQQIIDWTTGKTNEIKTNDNNNTQSILNAITSQTQSINNNTNTQVQNSTNSINQTNTNNTNNIINNNTQNTENEINNYNDSLKRCAEGITDLSGTLSVSQKYLMNNGTLREHSNFDVSDYIEVSPSTNYEIDIDPPFTSSQWASFCQYNENKQLIGCTQYGTNRVQTFTTNANTKYMLFSFVRDGSQNMMLKGYTCTIRSEEDLTASDKRPVNNSGVEGYISSENTLKSQMNTDSLNSVDIDIDLNSNNWIWQTMTAFFNTHTAIMTMVISILSIGVIKLVLTR